MLSFVSIPLDGFRQSQFRFQGSVINDLGWIVLLVFSNFFAFFGNCTSFSFYFGIGKYCEIFRSAFGHIFVFHALLF